MSSVVNKSGTRFIPKLKQRRLLSAAPKNDKTTITPEGTRITEEVSTTEGDTKVDDSNSRIDNKTDHETDQDTGTTAVSEQDDENPKAPSQLELDPIQTSTQLTSVQGTGGGRRASRLDSLSSNQTAKPVFKPDYLEPTPVMNNRRLSTIAKPNLKKVRINTIAEKDSTLQALKKRRMSIRTSISKKSGSAHRISVVSRRASPDTDVHTATAVAAPNASSQLFQKTDSLYEKYTIRNLKEIPKNIQDTDSERYLIDEEEFTMAELCKPKLPIGEISDNFEKAKLAGKAKFEKRRVRRELRRRAREEFKSINSLNEEEEERELEERKKAAEKLLNAEVPESNQGPHTAIQLRLNQDGTMVVDEESTVVDRHKNASYQNAHKVKLNENPFENLHNSGTYGKNMYTDPWTKDELIQFYKALSMWGTDFNLIAQMFPYRTRKQVKAKFISEERRHPVTVELALRSRLPPNFEQYCAETKKDIGTVESFHERIERLKEQHEEHMKAIDEAKANAKEEDAQNTKSSHNPEKKTSGGFRTDQVRAYRKSEIVLGTIDDLKKHPSQQVEEEQNYR
ncbi:hypothetical protein HG536_0B03400 [Torulaspora globosa]|uniref:SANT domain-containing protein n=1 Tax=Torulaspora globosa TaxID=48254 RepID=A0A7G3ZD91_9SACH|nr:uncharacterized protein HG536_0B03400 [Torulaspora globosa]QLL31477.1 hypothetical protein HG536_0B03400 [Torulaspora globosa]